MLGPLELATLALFGAWLLLSVVTQSVRVEARVPKRVRASPFIPNWRFFGPNPISADYELVIVDLGLQGDADRARHLALAEQRRLRHGIWNPARRRGKAVVDAVRALGAAHRTEPSRELSQSAPYQILENYCRRVPSNNPVVHERCFLIVWARPALSGKAPNGAPGAPREFALVFQSYPLRIED